jgi:hypothetical protein
MIFDKDLWRTAYDGRCDLRLGLRVLRGPPRPAPGLEPAASTAYLVSTVYGIWRGLSPPQCVNDVLVK